MLTNLSILIFSVLFSYLLFLWITIKKREDRHSDRNVKDVKLFYNQTTDKFLAVYGEIIQAFRTNDVEKYLHYTLKNMRAVDGMKLLDAGCGIAGPASYFAKKLPNSSIDACSVSEVQIEKAMKQVKDLNLENQISARVGDYHLLNEIYPLESYDRVYFLESYGHSNDKRKLLHGVWDVLKPGGMVYIKDLFQREVENDWEQYYIDKICEDINEAYKYHIGSLYETLSILRKKGYIIHYIKIPEVAEEDFEHLSISNDFQNLFNIGKIDSWEDYVFPIDFFEILAEKPKFSNEIERHLYFMNKS